MQLVSSSWLGISLGISKGNIEEFFNPEDFRCSLDQLAYKLGLLNHYEVRSTGEVYLAKNSIAFLLGNTLSIELVLLLGAILTYFTALGSWIPDRSHSQSGGVLTSS